MSNDDPVSHVALRTVAKHYGGVYAVKEVSLDIARGTVHALVGENGAGKSTISKIIAGAVQPNSGDILVDGKEVHLSSPRQALALGIAIIEQELAMVPGTSVIDNVFLGMESGRGGFVDKKTQRKRFKELVDRTGFNLRPDTKVSRLRVADQQKVEILRALARDAKLIIMDEPTAPLTLVESEQLYAVIRDLRDAGTTIIYVSHFLEEVLALADTVTVMRDGRHVQTAAASQFTEESLVHAMLGRALDEGVSRARKVDASPALELRGLSAKGRFADIDLVVRPGEIVGVAGLIGAGRTELLRAIAGADRIDSGEVLLNGKASRWRSPRAAMRDGVVMLPESRKEQGLVLMCSIASNALMSGFGEVSRFGMLSRRREKRVVAAALEAVDVRMASSSAPVSTLSGGNQQKVLLAKCLNAKPKVLLIDEPTRGVDVGAKSGIRDMIQALVDNGMAVVLVSSELKEVIAMSDRIVVMRRGRVAGQLDAADATEEAILTAAFGAAS